MYILNDIAKERLLQFKLKAVAGIVGINYDNLSKMIKQDKPCIKLTAYALTKFLDKEAEIKDYFDKKGE